jgi:chromosome partitioning protein
LLTSIQARRASHMPVIALLAQKGGAGKSTMAVHLAVLSGDALVLDLDRQQSATDWWKARDESLKLPEVVSVPASDITRGIARTARQWVFLDTAPAIDSDAKLAAKTADLILIPARPAILDLRAIRHTVGIVREIGAEGRAVIVLNAVPAGRGAAEAGVVTEARRALRAYGLPVAPVAVGNRVSLAHALVDGRAVTEFDPEGRAAQEIISLWEWLKCHDALKCSSATSSRPRPS